MEGFNDSDVDLPKDSMAMNNGDRDQLFFISSGVTATCCTELSVSYEDRRLKVKMNITLSNDNLII